MTSREEFMRQLGLTTDDLVKPPAEAGAQEKPRSRARVDFDDSASTNRFATPKSSMPAAAAPAASAKNQSREDFLRSLGIDNFSGQGPAAAPARNATGSQEYPRPERQQATPARNQYGRASRHADEDEDAYANTYAPRMHESSPADITLGRKPSMHKAPDTPGLDAELKAMSDAAGAEEVKALGNKYFQAGEYRKAVRLYTRAIELDGTNAALYSNRSAAYLLGGKQMGIDTRSMALRDADKTIKLKPTWFKGHSRRGDALFKLERYEEAAEAYESALELDPNNTSIVSSLNEVRPFMAKKKDPNVSGSWSAPGAGILHSSVTSQSATKPTCKSAYEMLDEFHAQRERDTPQLGRGGSDYKAAQLEKFRQRTSGSSDTFESESFGSRAMPSSNVASPVTPATSGERVNVRNLPSDFNSDAARDYQNSLLEQYRKKKAAAAAGRR